jgi:hypothetical protein
MNPEDLSFATWQLEQFELDRVREAIRQADCGRLVAHMTAVHLFKRGERSQRARTSWSDAVIGELRSVCDHFAQCSGGNDLKERFLGQVFSAVEFICKRPTIGHSGRVHGTREWQSGSGWPTIVYRELADEIQVLGVLVSYRKLPHMKIGSV